MCGEHDYIMVNNYFSKGSSPHARGTLALPVGVRPTAGIIPACAGNTLGIQCQCIVVRDHPRMRGEHITFRTKIRSFEGSSPHARGTHRSCFNPCSIVGIIPACAGNTRLALGYVAGTGDHPRMRGEHPSFRKENSTRKGSSPHARGTRRLRLHEIVMRGIIPACAGNTVTRIVTTALTRDHPRMRGEHLLWCVTVCGGLGSSPHARGTRWGCEGVGCVGGIIPACAGNTVRSAAWRRPARDHPRMRGEHSARSACVYPNLGSSPHARGTHMRCLSTVHGAGIIPACAGNTQERV